MEVDKKVKLLHQWPIIIIYMQCIYKNVPQEKSINYYNFKEEHKVYTQTFHCTLYVCITLYTVGGVISNIKPWKLQGTQQKTGTSSNHLH